MRVRSAFVLSVALHGSLAAAGAARLLGTSGSTNAAGDTFSLPEREPAHEVELQTGERGANGASNPRDQDSPPVTHAPAAAERAATRANSDAFPPSAQGTFAPPPTIRTTRSVGAVAAAPPSGAIDAVAASGAPAARYGAAGDASAQDLATAFVRAFPPSASADAMWATAALGPCGDTTLLLELDASGALIGHQTEPAVGEPFARGIARALSLIAHRAFTARSATTRLQLKCTLHADDVHDGLHGDVFALGASFYGNEGSGFFALAIGRRVDLTARVR